MSTVTLLRQMYRYQSWANREFIDKLQDWNAQLHPEQRYTALRLLNHTRLVSAIFKAHLSGTNHNLASDNPTEIPSLNEMRTSIAASDDWYQTYLEQITAEQLAEKIPFVFTDGDHGCMSREEMLTHVVTHNGYHRGEIGHIMKQLQLDKPWDTYAVFLHSTEPARRTMR